MPRNTAGLCLGLIVLTATVAAGADWPQWRGPDRDGVSKEKGLLKSWPKDGPTLLWEAKGVGVGFSTVSISNGRIFTMGDRQDGGYMVALEESTGKELWALKVGKNGGNYSGTRCTPTVDGKLVYALGQFGDLVCAESATGKEVWRKSLEKEFGGQVGGWNYSESPLVDGKKLVCCPGGPQATIVALDKTDGQIIWKSAVPGGDRAEYSSIVISQAAGVRQYVVLLAGGTVGVAAEDGKFLWKYDRLGSNTANIPTPIVFKDFIFTAAGYGKGGALLKIVRKGSGLEAQEVYYSNELKNKHGGVVHVGQFIYGDHDDSGRPWCAQLETGKVLWRKDVRTEGSGSAAILHADGRLYVRYQNSVMTLVDDSPEAFREISSFKIPDDMNESWPHPVICGGRLYLRGMNKLLCYDIKAK